MPEFAGTGRLPKTYPARLRRFANSFNLPGSGTGTIEISLPGNTTTMAWVISPDPAPDTDRKAIRVRLASNNLPDQDQIELGVRNKTGYVQISNNTDKQFWRVDDDGMQFSYRSQIVVNSNTTIVNAALGAWVAIDVPAAAVFSYDDWLPTGGTGVIMRIDFSDTGSLTVANSLIQKANDLSGNNNHLWQNTAGNRPVTSTLNGLTVAQTAKTSIELMGATPLTANVENPYTLLVVGKFSPQGGTFAAILSDTTGIPYIRVVNGNTVRFSAGSVVIDGAIDANTSAIIGVMKDNDGSFYVNGGSGTSGDPGGTGMEHAWIGAQNNAANPADALYGEVIIVNSVVNTAKLNEIGEHWADKWGINWTTIP